MIETPSPHIHDAKFFLTAQHAVDLLLEEIRHDPGFTLEDQQKFLAVSDLLFIKGINTINERYGWAIEEYSWNAPTKASDDTPTIHLDQMRTNPDKPG